MEEAFANLLEWFCDLGSPLALLAKHVEGSDELRSNEIERVGEEVEVEKMFPPMRRRHSFRRRRQPTQDN